jgi:hypothetical protein
MAKSKQLLRGLCATTALAAVLATAPVQVALHPEGGVLALRANAAFAESGGDDHGDDSHGQSDHGSDHGDDSHGQSDHGSNDSADNDHGGTSDRSSSDRGDDNHGQSDHGSNDSADNDHGSTSDREDPVVEVDGDRIQITYPDGWREEIENGRYEMRDPDDNTVVERAATGEDRSRLDGMGNF